MFKFFLFICLILLELCLSFKISQFGQNVHSQKYLPCRNIPNVIFMVNNNSISTATPDQKNIYIAVTGKATQIYRYPITKNFSEKVDQTHIYNNEDPFQTLKQANFSSSTDITNDGLYLVVGSASGNTHIYVFDNSQYVFRQTLKNSYDSNGGRAVFSNDGQYLFTIGSPKQIIIYKRGANLFQLFQNISITLQSLTIFSLSHDDKHFTVIQMQKTNTYVSMFTQQSKQTKYIQLAPSKLLNKLVLDMSMNRNFIAVVLGTLRSNCSTIIYKISPDYKNLDEFQQIFLQGACAVSGYLSDRDQLILTNGYFISTVYQYDWNQNGFIKKYDMYHSAEGVPVHTQVRLLDTDLQHLLIYTGVQINVYCPGNQSLIKTNRVNENKQIFDQFLT